VVKSKDHFDNGVSFFAINHQPLLRGPSATISLSRPGIIAIFELKSKTVGLLTAF
jgi:hypothetical protein